MFRASNLAVGTVVLAMGVAAYAADAVKVDADSVVKYILSCEKPQGGFGPIDQDYADSRQSMATNPVFHFTLSQAESVGPILRRSACS